MNIDLKCPKCGSSDLVQPSATVPAINPHASRQLAPQELAANPDHHVRCVNCDSRLDAADVDPTSERFAFLQAEYNKPRLTA